MLSYRHAFHAGGYPDVLKHGVLVWVLGYLLQKPTPLYVLDTHAGAGAYDLTSERAVKTGEFRAGVARLVGAPEPVPELFRAYLGLVAATDASGTGAATRTAALSRPPRTYPGSPVLIAAVLRPQDRAELAELHPTDHRILLDRFRGSKRIRVRNEDGLALMRARLPPPERRAVVLIDPSWEVKSEYETVPQALIDAYRRFPQGVYILWYPVIERARSEVVIERLRTAAIPRQYRLELGMLPDGAARGMTGCGLVLINPPWTFPQAVAEGLPWLAERLGATGPVTAGWLAEGP